MAVSYSMMIDPRRLRQRSWAWLLRHILLPAGDLAFGQPMMQRLCFLEQAQWWQPDRLYEQRNKALQQLVTIACHEVPFYQQLFKEAGITPADIHCPDDLRHLPVVTKDMLRARYPEQTTRQTRYKTHIAHTSGSTGKNFRVLEDSETRGWNRAAFMLALEWSGWRLGSPQLQTGMSLERSLQKRLKDWLLRCHYVSAFDLSDVHLDMTLNILAEHQIDYLWGYPGSLYYLARRAKQLGWNRPLRSAVTWGDNLFAHYRQTIEAAFQTRVFDTYGCAEGIQVAAQCPCMNYHIYTLDTIVEYLDAMGKPAKPEQIGQLILTRMHPGAMPLIRYQVGDMGTAGDQTSCPCGRGFDRMESIQGRDTDVVLTPAGNRLIVHFFTGILAYFPQIDSFQVVQDSADSIVLRLVPTPGFTEAIQRRVVSQLKEKGAADLEICVELVEDIPLPPTGKRRFVISRL